MWFDSENVLFVLSLLVQLIGVGGVFAARLYAHMNPSRKWDVLAFVCVGVVGVLSLLLMRACTGSWLAFATTMPLMAVGATIDLGKRRPTWDL